MFQVAALYINVFKKKKKNNFVYLLVLVVLDLRCYTDFSLAVARRGCSPVAVCGLLPPWSTGCREGRLQQRASWAPEHRFTSCGPCAGLVARSLWDLSKLGV